MSKKKKPKPAPKPPADIRCSTPGCSGTFDLVIVAKMVVENEFNALLYGYTPPPALLVCSLCKTPSTVDVPTDGETLFARPLTPNERFRAEAEVPHLLRAGERGDLAGLGVVVGVADRPGTL